MTAKPLTHRDLNRATLARHFLLERSDTPIVDAIEILGGLQAQQTHDPYIALWSRLKGFRHEDLTALIVDRTLNRATTMRGTLHLHTANDLLGYRALVQPFLAQQWKSNFLKRFGSEDPNAVRKAGIKLLDNGPMTAGALNKVLKEKFPTAEPLALSTLLQLHEVLVQIPPTRIWGNNAAPILTRVENWLPPPRDRPMSKGELTRRYIRAFGPVTVADMATWCRLTKLGREFEAIRDELVTFEDVDGRTLYDFPDAPRPDADTPAPVRFLPLYDNVYLGYDNRRRMLSEATAHLINMFQNFKPAVLIDGTCNAGWTIADKKGGATLEIEPYRALTRAEQLELEAEGEAFLGFMRPDASTRTVAILKFQGA
jgi:hypothetical protein